MQDFIKKWKNDSKYKTKMQLLFYTAFVVFVGIFAVSGQNNISEDNLKNQLKEESDKKEEINNNITKEIIEIPEEYNYKINITINGKMHQYIGNKKITRENIIKSSNNIDNYYIYEKNKYYKKDSGENYILTTKEEVYDIVDYNYLDLNTINQYLKQATKNENEYIVYLKNIILGNNTQEYIIITINNNKIKIDYTNLFKIFDKTINQYLIDIEIE